MAPQISEPPTTIDFCCLGWATSKKRRCTYCIAGEDKTRVWTKLSEIRHGHVTMADLLPKLRVIASSGLCPKYHKDQANKIAEDWFNKRHLYFPQLLAPVAAQPPRQPVFPSTHSSPALMGTSTARIARTVVQSTRSHQRATQEAPSGSTPASRLPSIALLTHFERRNYTTGHAAAIVDVIPRMHAPRLGPLTRGPSMLRTAVPAAAPVQRSPSSRIDQAASTASDTRSVADSLTHSSACLHASQVITTIVEAGPPDGAQRHTRSTTPETLTRTAALRLAQQSAVNASDTARQPRPLSIEERAIIKEACSRWQAASTVTPSMGKQCFRDMISVELAHDLAGHHDLLLLIAGLAYVQDNGSSRTAARHHQRVKRALQYISRRYSTELLCDCNEAAAQSVARCGDRVSYGLTQVEQVIEVHRLEHNDLAPKELFRGIRHIFLQQRIEAHAIELSGNHRESVEVYLDLSQKLRARGFDLLDTSNSNTYGALFGVTDMEADTVAEALREDLNGPSDVYIDMFLGNPAVEQTLRCLFPESFSQMDDERDEFTDQAQDAMFDANSSRRARAGEDILQELANFDKDWYKEKTLDVLRNIEMLG